MSKTAQEILRGAAQVIRSKGWTQKVGVNRKTGGHCAMAGILVSGGCAASIDGEDFVGPTSTAGRIAVEQATDALYTHLFIGPPVQHGLVPQVHVAAWNDQPGRTVEDVLAALEGAADALDLHEAAERAANETRVEHELV